MTAWNTGALVAVVAGAARKRVLTAFQDAGALSADRAIAFEPERGMDRTMFDRMARDGVLRQTPDGRWWLDATAMQAARSRRVKLLLLALVSFGAAFAATRLF